MAFYPEFVDGREYCEKPFTNDWTPLYTHADAGRVERLHNSHVKSLEALNQQSEKQRDHWIDECKTLRAQLAERDALLRRCLLAVREQHCDEGEADFDLPAPLLSDIDAALGELKDAMDLAYLTGQRPADVLVMRRDDIEGKALGVKQNKTHKKLRILLEVDGIESSLGALIRKMLDRNGQYSSPYLLRTEAGKRVTASMLRHRWDAAREEAVKGAIASGDQVLAGRISQFQFRDIRPKAASEIVDVDHASLLMGHTKGDITERVYRRVGALAKPTK